MILKFFLITILVIFVLVKIGSFIFKTMFWMLGARAGNRNAPTYKQNQQRQTYRSAGDIEIEYVPGKEPKDNKSDFKGGEYVDFEEVK
jgi:hypothetical protein